MSRADAALRAAASRAARATARAQASSLRQRAPARVRALIAVGLVMASVAALGYGVERARAYFARELAECGAWYELVAEAPGLDEITRIQFRAVATSLISTSADVATEPWALTQRDLAAKTIRREMGDSWKNYAVVDRKYGQRCRDVVTDPVARRKYWLDKYD
ncbi:MAG TPA: hypothetical protein VFJ48_08785 [Casimicrobiaceae bacterium]|nr:hypothetical protein [Casimicrobiaceae bacterium]